MREVQHFLKVVELKALYGQLYMTEFDNEGILIWRTLKRDELEVIMRDDESGYLNKEKVIIKRCVVWPEVDNLQPADFWSVEDVISVFNQIVDKSEYNDLLLVREANLVKCKNCETDNKIKIDYNVMWRCYSCGHELFDFFDLEDVDDFHDDYFSNCLSSRENINSIKTDTKDITRIFYFISQFPSFFPFSYPDLDYRNIVEEFYNNYELPEYTTMFSFPMTIDNRENALVVLVYADILAMNGNFNIIKQWANRQDDDYTRELIEGYCNFCYGYTTSMFFM